MNGDAIWAESRPLSFSLSIIHAKHRPERVENLRKMLHVLTPLSREVPFALYDEPCPEGRRYVEWQHDLHPRVWGRALQTGATHHVFMTDDLRVHPQIWDILAAIVTGRPGEIIGLMSNSPYGPALYEANYHGYITNAWVCGPAYVMPHEHLGKFLPWYMANREIFRSRGWGDDTAVNEWVTNGGGPGAVFHPIPCPIEHRADLTTTTTGPADPNPYERVSWREFEPKADWLMTDYWTKYAPRVKVG